MNILLIEDNSDHVLLTARILKNADASYQLDAVADPQEGVQKIISGGYDMVLCDYRMPGLSGLDILKKMIEHGSDTPFIVITSAGSEKIAVELMKSGAYDYIVKDALYSIALPLVIQKALDRYQVKKEKNRLEKELVESNKKLQKMYAIKSDFISVVSHELRTPLTAIKEGISQMLDDSAGELTRDQKEMLDITKRNVDRLTRLINDVLDFSKLESRKMGFTLRVDSINKRIQEIVDMHQALAKEKGLYLTAELDQSAPCIPFDADRITQVLSNIIGNAVKFTATGGITVKSYYDEQKKIVGVRVADTGEGMRADDIPKLFQKFQQLNDAKNMRRAGGTGLGLAISKEIVEQHSGSIWAESEFGKGSAFIFTLPLKRTFTVLLIDDEKIQLTLCERILKKSGHTVFCAENGIQGIEIARQKIPHAVVVDMKLGQVSGYEVIGRLKSMKETAQIPILVMSGFQDEIEKVKARENNSGFPWILKPLNTDEFLAQVEIIAGGAVI